LSLLYDATVSLSTAASLHEAIPIVLRTICTHLDWDLGVFWGVDTSGAVLESRDVWHRPDIAPIPLADEWRSRVIAPGDGLAGRVWLDGAPVVIPDVADSELPRAQRAYVSGLRGAMAFPIQGMNDVHGVMQFVSRHRGALDANLVEALTAIGVQVGQFIERLQAEEALQHQALHDALTNLPNRSLLQNRLYQALRVAQSAGAPVALLLMDLDRFKEVNDTLGHHCGDLLLQHVGAHVSGALRTTDTVARLGGDEFAVLLPETDEQGAIAAAQKILQALATPMLMDGRQFEVRSSIGIALYPEHGADAATLLRRADVAMYTAKRAGSGHALYDLLHDEHNPARLMLASELRHAIARDELVLHYQPEVAMCDGRVQRVEALARWQHPQRGLIPPTEFIPLAEEIGLITALTQWVLETALRQCSAWRDAGYTLGVAVNLSVRTLHDPSFPDTVAWLLRRYGIAPAMLTLEITESTLMSKPVQARAVLTRLAEQGIAIAIDDFGTGYSSLGHLRRLPVDEIKIDKSFVLGMTADAKDTAIVRSIVDMSRHLGLRVVAEGIEDRASWDALAGMGCAMAQGYYLSRPLPAPALQQWLAHSQWGPGMQPTVHAG
ncbi:MAG: EAL domain-containing protein, partial [Chloroflexota bacterium]|nr:EAL domain-containing protein [Chloroflexota bacterium]